MSFNFVMVLDSVGDFFFVFEFFFIILKHIFKGWQTLQKKMTCMFQRRVNSFS